MAGMMAEFINYTVLLFKALETSTFNMCTVTFYVIFQGP